MTKRYFSYVLVDASSKIPALVYWAYRFIRWTFTKIVFDVDNCLDNLPSKAIAFFFVDNVWKISL